MTETEWLASDDPAAMLRFMTGKHNFQVEPTEGRTTTARKLRLFAAGCCRQVWDKLTDERSRRAVEAAERYTRTGRQRRKNWIRLGGESGIPDDERGSFTKPFWAVQALTLTSAVEAARNAVAFSGTPPTVQTALLRCVFGNPWRQWQCRCDPEVGITDCEWCDEKYRWLAWNNHTVPKMARTLYNEQHFEDLPFLADALEDAGCTEEEILRHLRGEQQGTCRRCGGDGKAHGADRPFEWSSDVDYGKCVICKGTGVGIDWLPAGPTCPKCKGRGKGVFDKGGASSQTCPDCSGTGRLPPVHARGCWVVDLLLNKE